MFNSLHCEGFFLVPRQHFSWSNTSPLPLTLVLCILVKRTPPSSPQLYFRYWKTVIRSLLSSLFSRLKNLSSFNLSSYHVLQPSNHLFGLPVFQCFSWTRGTKTGHDVPGANRSGIITSLQLLTVWLVTHPRRLFAAFAGSCSACFTPGPFSRAAFQPVRLWLVLLLGISLSGAGL